VGSGACRKIPVFIAILAGFGAGLADNGGKTAEFGETGFDSPGLNTMKTRDFDVLPRNNAAPPALPRERRKRRRDGVGFGPALLGVVCVIGVFGLLALLYH